ncbi:MAG: hypothetical protein MUF19_02645 [Candidatus Pacebacteria bacterium]|jgi:hypothetical protein|nr:hypothetical protein [Candidatus Paceibacterota bacterium]
MTPSEYKERILESVEYKSELEFLHSVTFEIIDCIRYLKVYSSRASHIYEKLMIMWGYDNIVESTIGIHTLVVEGSRNPSRRELRFLLEMIAKYVYIDQQLKDAELLEKIEFFEIEVPKSSLSIIRNVITPFEQDTENEFISEALELFKALSKFVHPSREQLELQINEFNSGHYMGFESAESFKEFNQTYFQILDIVLVLCFIGFGTDMSADVLEDIAKDSKWQFANGKYTQEFIKIALN